MNELEAYICLVLYSLEEIVLQYFLFVFEIRVNILCSSAIMGVAQEKSLYHKVQFL